MPDAENDCNLQSGAPMSVLVKLLYLWSTRTQKGRRHRNDRFQLLARLHRWVYSCLGKPLILPRIDLLFFRGELGVGGWGLDMVAIPVVGCPLFVSL